MIQQLPTRLRKLFATTDSEWLHQCWHYVWLDYGVVPVVFDEDGSDDMLKEHIEREFSWKPYAVVCPRDTVVVDVTDCQDWKPIASKPVKVFLQGPRTKAFDAVFKQEFEFGPDGNKRVFYVFEIEERDE